MTKAPTPEERKNEQMRNNENKPPKSVGNQPSKQSSEATRADEPARSHDAQGGGRTRRHELQRFKHSAVARPNRSQPARRTIDAPAYIRRPATSRGVKQRRTNFVRATYPGL